MKTIICIDNPSYSAFNFEVITNINTYVADYLDEISLCSLDQSMPFGNINTAIFTPNEMDSFNGGVIIAGNIKNAERILSCANNSKKVLYLYDLDWMFELYDYDYLYSILNHKDLRIFARNQSHVHPIRTLSNREPDVINNFDLEKIWNLL